MTSGFLSAGLIGLNAKSISRLLMNRERRPVAGEATRVCRRLAIETRCSLATRSDCVGHNATSKGLRKFASSGVLHLTVLTLRTAKAAETTLTAPQIVLPFR